MKSSRVLITALLTLSFWLPSPASQARFHPKKRKVIPPHEDVSTIEAPPGLVVLTRGAHEQLESAVHARYAGHPEEALHALENVSGDEVPFAADNLLRGILALDLEKYDEALKFLSAAAKNAGRLADYVRYYTSQTLLALNRPQEALDQLVGISKSGRLIEWDLLKVRLKTLEAMGRKPEAQETRAAIRKAAPDTNNLLETPSHQEIYQHLLKQQNVPAEDLARAAFKARVYDDAARLFEQVWNQQAGGNSAEILSLWASSLGRSGNALKAIEINRKLMSLFPRTTEAWKAEEKIAYLYFDSGQFDKASAAYTALIQKKKDLEDNRWNLFWCYYLKKDHRNALKVLEDLGINDDTTRYWKARVLDQTGKQAQARDIYSDLSNSRSNGYYASLARQRLKGHLDPQTIVNVGSGNNHDPLRDALPLSLPTNDPLSAAVALNAIGEYRYAFDESLRSAKGNLAPRTALNWSLAGNYFKAYLSGTPYPRAYQALVTLNAQANGLAPAFVWAIMRQESNFRPAVASPSMAFGLMQIIPPTAHEIAKALGEEPFAVTTLTDPEVSIRFGSWYLKSLLTHFGGNLPEAIAAYNAGPEAVERWKKWGHLEPDEFIDLIPFNETNNYVKRVLMNFWHYQSE